MLGFGPAKVENEVLSLMLLAKTCPKIPVSRVVAFSEDGQALRHYRQDRTVNTTLPADDLTIGPPGWISMTCSPGKPLDSEKRSRTSTLAIIRQLIPMIVEWKTLVPGIKRSGNLSFRPLEDKSLELDLHLLTQLRRSEGLHTRLRRCCQRLLPFHLITARLLDEAN